MDSNAFFNEMFGGAKPHSAEENKAMMENILISNFADFAAIMLVKTYLESCPDPNDTRDRVLKSWKRVLWERYNQVIKQQAKVYEGNPIASQMGLDTETMRVQIHGHIRNAEKAIVRILGHLGDSNEDTLGK